MNIKKFLVGTAASALMLGAMAIPAFAAGNPSADADCSEFIATPGYDLYREHVLIYMVVSRLAIQGRDKEYTQLQLLLMI